jgi:hypothetical protein
VVLDRLARRLRCDDLMPSPAARQLPGRIGGRRSSGIEHDLAKVGVEGSNPFARSNYYQQSGFPGHQHSVLMASLWVEDQGE